MISDQLKKWIAVALVLDPTMSAAQDASVMRPVEASCGISLFAPARMKVVSAHMEPNFEPGKCYSFRPVDGVFNRGDVVTVESMNGLQFMRVVGLPDDTVQMVEGRLILNNTPVSTEAYTGEKFCQSEACSSTWLVESLSAGRYIVLDWRETRGDTTDPVSVPDGKVFLLGDNRDNAADSRFPAFGLGLVNIDAIRRVARVEDQ